MLGGRYPSIKSHERSRTNAYTHTHVNESNHHVSFTKN